MKLIIAGGREFTDADRMTNEINKLNGTFLPTDGQGIELVCGMARGADITAYHLFNAAGFPIHEFPADWNTLGKRAGFVRNADMACFADALIAFWDGESPGTRHMINTMQSLNKPVYVIYY